MLNLTMSLLSIFSLVIAHSEKERDTSTLKHGAIPIGLLSLQASIFPVGLSQHLDNRRFKPVPAIALTLDLAEDEQDPSLLDL